MANQLKANPWSVDTAGVLTTAPVRIYNVQFAGYSVATDEVVLADRNGNEVARLRGSDDFAVVTLGQDLGWVNGLTLVSLSIGSTGKLFIYLK